MEWRPSGPQSAPPSIDDVAAAARILAPGGALKLIRTPADAGAAWTAEFAHPRGTITVHVDQATGVARRAPVQAPWRTSLTTNGRIHTGETGGPLWRILVFLTGLAPTLLGITGVIMWLRRRRVRN